LIGEKFWGDDWREVQRTWIHRLGNLTLTGYNSTYSDRSFEEKKNIAGGSSDSAVRLNRFVREQSVWTAKQMDKRGKNLASKAAGIWPSLVVDKSLVDAAGQQEMRELAKRRDVANVKMTPNARALFETLRAKIKGIDPEVVEMAEEHSVSYHGPAFFLEVLPRKRRIALLLALDFNEVADREGSHVIPRNAASL